MSASANGFVLANGNSSAKQHVEHIHMNGNSPYHVPKTSAATAPSFLDIVRETNMKISSLKSLKSIVLDGYSLDVASLVAVAMSVV